jgi:hypothetical protein
LGWIDTVAVLWLGENDSVLTRGEATYSLGAAEPLSAYVTVVVLVRDEAGFSVTVNTAGSGAATALVSHQPHSLQHHSPAALVFVLSGVAVTDAQMQSTVIVCAVLAVFPQ